MTANPKRKLTAAEYLAIENAAPYKSEFYDGEMFAMSGASPAHNFINDNLVIALGNALRGSGCRTASRDQRVRGAATGPYMYPDALVFCGPGEFAPDDPYTLLNPKVVIEILSESTRRFDCGAKLRRYQAIASLAEYVLIEQDEPVVERYVRQPDGRWGFDVTVGLDAEFVFAAVAARVRLADLYADVTFPPLPPGVTPGVCPSEPGA